MDDIKKKLLLLGGVLALFVIGGVAYSILWGEQNPPPRQEIRDDGIPDLDEEISEFTEKVKDFKEKISSLEQDKTHAGSKIRLSKLQKEFSNTLSEEIKRVCRKDTLNKTHYYLVKKETLALIEKISNDENLSTSKKDLETFRNVHIRFYKANEVSKILFFEVDSIFKLKKYDSYSADITKYKNTSFIKENKSLMKLLRKGEDLLEQWKNDARRFTTFNSNREHVERILTDCKNFSGNYYKTECEKQRYISYRHHFTKESNDVGASSLTDPNKSKFVLDELDCSLIDGAPLSEILKSKRGHGSKSGSFYKDCLKIRQRFQNANKN